MNFLDLVNQVLVRLREDTVTTSAFQSDPFYRVIGASINDAKRACEDSWQWSQLRYEVDVPVLQGQTVVTIPSTADRQMVIQSILVVETAAWMVSATRQWMKDKYRDVANTPVQENNPYYYGWTYDEPTTGDQQILIYPPPEKAYTLRLQVYKPQANLVEWDDRLLIPSLPVYQLGTALASRERGEVGNTPTSALFQVASTALSDAIAYDSAKFPEEMDWWSQDRLDETNVRNW